MEETHYTLLELPENATDEEIKKSYRKLSLKYHPDRNGGNPEMVSKFQKINEAYEVLGDAGNRKNYDMRKNPFMQNIGQAEGDMNDILSALFGGMGGLGGIHRMHVNGMNMGGMGGMMGGMPMGGMTMGGININGMNMGGMMGGMGPNIRVFQNGVPVNMQSFEKPQPIIINITINFEQVLNGANIPVECERWLIENNTKMFEKETLYINIPKGIDDNEIIMLADKGHIVNEQIKGDVKIFIKVDKHNDFERNGLDLLMHKTITLKEALCGFSFDLKYVNDKIYTINNKNGNIISPEYKKIIPGMGLSRDNHVGNLIIHFHIIFPEVLSANIINTLNELLP